MPIFFYFDLCFWVIITNNTIVNSPMTTNKNAFKICQCNLCLTFLKLEFIETVPVRIFDIVFFTFFDTLCMTFIISSHAITELSTVLFK